MVHCEQMFGLGGSFLLKGDDGGPYLVENKTELALKDVAVLNRDSAGKVHTAWIGDLPAKTSVPLKFADATDRAQTWLAQWDESPATSRNRPEKSSIVSLWRLIDLACNRMGLAKGEVRLVGWTDHEVPGLAIRPAAAQTTLRTLVLVHLRHAPLPPAQPDLVAKDDVQETTQDGPQEGEANPVPPPGAAATP
jgi:hypothetical protein